MKKKFVLLFCLILLAGCTSQPTNSQKSTRLAKVSELPSFEDDLNFTNLGLAFDRQIEWFKKNPNVKIKMGQNYFSGSKAMLGLEKFRELFKENISCQKQAKDRVSCQANFKNQVLKHFDVYVPNVDPVANSAFFTSYYSPTLKASVKKGGQMQYAVYGPPKGDLATRCSRVQIQFENCLAGQNLELFYVADLFDLFLLHVQGGGIIKLDDGKEQRTVYVHYAGSNKMKFSFISPYMKERGYIVDGKVATQRKYLLAHPEKAKEIYANTPSYVYFKIDEEPPIGVSVSLTPQRSIATDKNIYPVKGTLTYIEAERPIEEQDLRASNLKFKKFSRFMVDQDTGGAIRGNSRVDIYHGEDFYAEAAAYSTKHNGQLYFLMPK